MTSSPERNYRLALRVQPNASRNEFAGWTDRGSLKVRLQAPAQDGKANQALIAFLAKRCGGSKNQITLLRGASGRENVIAFERLSASQWQRLPRP